MTHSFFKTTPAKQTVEDFHAALATRLGKLPPVPATGFIGRSRELLALQRLLRHERYAVVRGQGGEGKTALAAEFARWMVRSHQVRRAAFVSVETDGNALAVLGAIGGQLVGEEYSPTAFDNLENAMLPVERALREQPTLLVVDNMESVLLPPYLETPEALSEQADHELKAILALCERLLKAGDTRLVFTSREALPGQFGAPRHRRELHGLDRHDAVKLVERALNADVGAGAGTALDAARESIEALVDAVNGNARALALLAPELRSRGVAATREALVELMATMEQRFPGSREHSLFASVELSLRRMSKANRQRARVLGVFHGGFNLDALSHMMDWEEEDVDTLAIELIATGLATPNLCKHLTLDPGLCPYLRGRMDAAEREALTARWVEAMSEWARLLRQQRSEDIEFAAVLTVLELPNLFALLDLVGRAPDAEATIDLAASLQSLLQFAGKPRLLERVGQVRDAAATSLGDTWNHARFEAARTRIEQQIDGGHLREALEDAKQLLKRTRTAGGQAYHRADYDCAMASSLLGQASSAVGNAEQALAQFRDAFEQFDSIAKQRAVRAAQRMLPILLERQGCCLLSLGRLDEAARAFEESIGRAEQLDDARQTGVGKANLGAVRLLQRRYTEALEACAEARERFTQLDEPPTIAVAWHQTGMVYQATGEPEAAEDAYRESLAINVQLGDVAGQARTLVQLGVLYGDQLNRPEEAVGFFRQAAEKFVAIRDTANEGHTRNNLGNTLYKLRRFDAARDEIQRAIQCKKTLGHAGSTWNSWNILARIERAVGSIGAAAEAKRNAIACYLAYRRDCGENHSPNGRIALGVTQSLVAGDPGRAESLLQEVVAESNLTRSRATFIRALEAIVSGSRDRALADAPDLSSMMAAEILFLIETLETPG